MAVRGHVGYPRKPKIIPHLKVEFCVKFCLNWSKTFSIFYSLFSLFYIIAVPLMTVVRV